MNVYKKKILKEMSMVIFMLLIAAGCIFFVYSTVEIFITSPAIKELIK